MSAIFTTSVVWDDGVKNGALHKCTGAFRQGLACCSFRFHSDPWNIHSQNKPVTGLNQYNLLDVRSAL